MSDELFFEAHVRMSLWAECRGIALRAAELLR